MSGGINYTERERLLEKIKVGIEQNVNAAYGRGFRAGKGSMELIPELKEQEYKRGFSDGEKSMAEKVNSEYRIDVETEIAERLRDEYEHGRSEGRQEAWEAARKIILTGADDGGIPGSDMREIFGNLTAFGIFREVGVDEVIEKIVDYEKQKEKDEIKVGDELIDVVGCGEKAVVTAILDCDEPYSSQRYKYIVMTHDGYREDWVRGFDKTGRHYPQIAEVMKQLNEGGR